MFSSEHAAQGGGASVRSSAGGSVGRYAIGRDPRSEAHSFQMNQGLSCLKLLRSGARKHQKWRLGGGREKGGAPDLIEDLRP